MNLKIPDTGHGTAQTMAGATAAFSTWNSSGRTPLVGMTSGIYWHRRTTGQQKYSLTSGCGIKCKRIAFMST